MANYKEKPKKKSSASRNIAIDKLDFYDEPKPKRKPSHDKIKGRPQSPWQRFCRAAFPQKDDETGDKVRKIVLIVLVIVFGISIGYLLSQLISIDNGEDVNKQTQELAGVQNGTIDMDDFEAPEIVITSITSPSSSATEPVEGETVTVEETEEINVTPVVNTPINADFASLTAANPDTVGWIKIQGTYLNNVIVKAEDNDYYLHRDFNGNDSISGTVFAHYKNKCDGTDDNLILFGHNMINGSFFASVRYYLPNDNSREPVAFYKVHPTVMVQTADGKNHVYKIFAGVLANTQKQYGEVFKYVNKTKFKNQKDFNDFAVNIMDRSWFYTDVDLQYGDKLLTLSTCYWPLGEEVDTRWVLFAREVRAGESEYVDTTVARRNYNPKLFDYFYGLIGGQWYGSQWDKSKLIGYTE